MIPFLEKISDYYLSLEEARTGNVCIVTPNRRAALFIRSHIGKKISKTMWAPDILSLEEFINRLSGLNIADNITLLMEFFRAFNKNETGNKAEKTNTDTPRESFEQILHWAPILLQDFDDIDSNLDNPDVLFENLSDIKQIEAWSPDGEQTLFQKQYIRFFKAIPGYYKIFKESLLSGGIAYQGLSHRVAASEIEKNLKYLPWGKVIFAGLNALNQSEEKIISSMLSNDKAVIIWDGDEYYLSGNNASSKHEAGMFIRKYRNKWQKNSVLVAEKNFKDHSKNLNILGIAKNINQIQLAGNILLSQIPEQEHEQTAVVLADEALMIPMLSALPPNVEKVNVTMGYPLSYTGFYSFAECVLSMHIRAANRDYGNTEKDPWLYYKDILTILKHPYSSILLKHNEENNAALLLSNTINKSNRSFYTLKHLTNICEGKEVAMVEKLFCNWNNSPARALGFFREALAKLENNHYNSITEESKEFSVEPAAFNRFNLLINRFELYLNNYGQPETLESLKLAFRNLVSGMRIPFSGEPLEGLQVMGLLETRNLDFKNLVIFPVNESILPKGKTQNSFIPFDVKVKFGLNTHKERDAIYAYHFYRLLQRAENIYLLYNTQADDTGGGEKSRFITQIEHELKEYNPDINIRHEIIPVMVDFESPATGLTIEKTPDIMKKMHGIGEKGFSPSSLGIYLGCSLQFYLRKIINIEESEEVEETIELSTMGLAVHDVLEKIFRPYIGKVIKEEDLKIEDEKLEKLLTEKFLHHYSDGDIETGKNYLLYRVALRMIGNYLEKERKDIRSRTSKNNFITIVSLENSYNSGISINTDKEMRVNLTGKVDRIDKTGNLYRVIDYKTGKVEAGDLKINQWDDLLKKPETAKSFQLLCYSWLFFNANKEAEQILPSIISLRNPGHGLFKLQHSTGDDGIVKRNDIKEFEENVLKPLFTELFDQDIPFRQTENEDNCRYCPFMVLCGKNM